MAKQETNPNTSTKNMDAKSQALDLAMKQIEKQFGKGSIMKMGDAPPVSIDAISTGSITLDHALGIGGVPRGRVVEIDLADSDLSDVMKNGVSLAYLPGAGMVRLRVSARGDHREAAQAGLDQAVERLRNDLGDRIFGDDDDTLEGVLGEMLVERSLTIAVAESCTGGSVASRIAGVPGASRYFLGGVVAYDNSVKIKQLGVSEVNLDGDGAVSEAVVRQMAEGVRDALGADVGVATTGIAGPDGGTPEKPVGTVWLGYANGENTHAVLLQLSRDRAINIALSTTAALNLVRRQLLRRNL